MTNQVAYTTSYNVTEVNNIAGSPSIKSGFGTSPTLTGANTKCFQITIGTGGSTGGTITLPTAPNGWSAQANNVTEANTVYLLQTAFTQNSVTLASFKNSDGTSATMNAGDNLLINCFSF
jgi:hypothetical protein